MQVSQALTICRLCHQRRPKKMEKSNVRLGQEILFPPIEFSGQLKNKNSLQCSSSLGLGSWVGQPVACSQYFREGWLLELGKASRRNGWCSWGNTRGQLAGLSETVAWQRLFLEERTKLRKSFQERKSMFLKLQPTNKCPYTRDLR